MRIAITGTNGIGKSSLIKDMLRSWKVYSLAKDTFRNDTDERYVTDMTEDNQQTILDGMVTELKRHGKSDNVLFDRCPVDNLVYTLHSYAKENGDISEEFVLESATKLKKALKMIDLIIFIPITAADKINIEDNLIDKGELDVTYAKEIDHIFKSLYREWEKKDSPYVEYDDKPHVLEIFGTPVERIELLKMYIDSTGDSYGESSIIHPDEVNALEKMNALLTQQSEIAEETRLDI